jgi:hypothetical protein
VKAFANFLVPRKIRIKDFQIPVNDFYKNRKNPCCKKVKYRLYNFQVKKNMLRSSKMEVQVINYSPRSVKKLLGGG